MLRDVLNRQIGGRDPKFVDPEIELVTLDWPDVSRPTRGRRLCAEVEGGTSHLARGGGRHRRERIRRAGDHVSLPSLAHGPGGDQRRGPVEHSSLGFAYQFPRRQAFSPSSRSGISEGPQSRGAGGVGGVAGERARSVRAIEAFNRRDLDAKDDHPDGLTSIGRASRGVEATDLSRTRGAQHFWKTCMRR